MVQHIFLFRQILCLSLSMILYPKLSRNRWSFCTWKSTKRNVNPWHLCTAVLTHSRTFCSPRASVLIFHVLQTKTMQKINTDKRLTRTVRLSIAKPWRKTHSFFFLTVFGRQSYNGTAINELFYSPSRNREIRQITTSFPERPFRPARVLHNRFR